MRNTNWDSFVLKPATFETRWNLDACQKNDGYFKLEGFAFKKGNDHYRYDISIILLDATGQAKEFEVQKKDRADVAEAFSEEHFLYNTGFIGYILECELVNGHEYELIIRLKNHFDSNDICDIKTGQTIKL